MIEKRYSLRPYGWPEEDFLILVARLLVRGDISLMMDGALIPLDKVYEAVTTPNKRRKITVLKRHTSDPKAIQDARALGKELFSEMGPDGEDALFAFLQGKLRGWQTNLNSFKPLADTGGYPGKDEVNEGLAFCRKLLALDESNKFIGQFNGLEDDLLEYADQFQELEQFYEHQRPTWEKLRKACDRFQSNRVELERNAQAGPALKRMLDILVAPSPYGLIKEAEGLIGTVGTVNTALVAERRTQMVEKIDAHLAALTRDIQVAGADDGIRASCLKPLQGLRQRVGAQESLAHIAQAEAEALLEFDAAVRRLEEFVKKASEKPPETPKPGEKQQPKVVLKQLKKVEPAKLTQKTYLETKDDVNDFLNTLREVLEKAIDNDERIQIR
jgi:hypothetical protein